MYLYRLYETFLNLPVGLQSVLLALLFMYLLHLSDNYLFKRRLAASFSLKPRQGNNLLSPLLAHTLHGDWKHLFSNSFPFLILGSIIALPDVQIFWVVNAVIMIIGSLGTWLLGSKGVHLGASGLVTGYFGYIVSRGFINQDVQAAMIGLLIGLFYFGIFHMVFRRFPGVSNVMHFFGFCGGLLAAYVTPWLIR
jgi:membrane associated rhomboid family serine protease